MKPRSSAADGAAPTASAGAVAAKDDDGFTTVKNAPAANKYVPPSQRKKMEEEEARPAAAKEPARSGGGGGSAGAGYEAPHVRKEREEKERKRDVKEREALEKQQAAEAADAAEKAAKKAAKDSKKARKDAEKEEFKQSIVKPKDEAGAKWDKSFEAVDATKIDAFSKDCAALLEDAEADVGKKADKMVAMLTETELQSVAPMICLLEPMLQACRRKEDEEVIGIVRRFAPLFEALIDKAKVHRFKVKMLCETQRLASKLGLPRLSPESALLEVFFDGLYQAEVIEEEYFHLWASASDDTPGKMNALFQVNVFMDWLRNATVEGEESESEDEKEGGEEEEQSDDDEEESDIEENIPKRGTKR